MFGRSVPRPDGLDKVRGRTRYLDDLPEEGCWFGATVRSPHASARIASIDTSAARAADSEAVVLTAKDIGPRNVIHLIADDWPALADQDVAHVAQAVALVAAPTAARARAAARRVAVSYEPLPATLSIDDAIAQPHQLAECAIDQGDAPGLIAEPPAGSRVATGVYRTPHQEHAYIEPHGVIATPLERADGAFGVDVVGSLQCPYYVHKALTHLFACADDAIRVRQCATGGGFGGKEDYPDMISAHAALLARASGRRVKIVYDRHEDIVATTKRHPSHVRITSVSGADGALIALDVEVTLDGGAFVTLSPVVLSRAVLHAGGAYRCPNVRIRGRVLRTNTAPNGAFRGFGAPQSLFAIERHMDRVARESGMDPIALRRANAYRAGDVTPTGQVLKDSVAALACLDRAFDASGFDAARSKRTTPKDGEPLRGVGITLFWHGSGFTGNGERRLMSVGSVRLAADGRVEVLASSTDFGQGTESVFRQIVAEACGAPLDDVTVHPPDTSVVPDSGPTVASRTVMVVGGLLSRAAADLRGKLDAFRGEARLDASTPFRELARRYVEGRGALRCDARFEPVPGASFDETTYRGDAYSAYGWGAAAVEVEVDPDTLVTRIVKLTTVSDVGRVVNPVLCAGQVEGGTLQALGWGSIEEIKMKDGRYLNDRLQTYIIPTFADAPDMQTILLEQPTRHGPYGAKGVGELPMDGGASALLQAIEHATGLVLDEIPATPERLLAARRRRAA